MATAQEIRLAIPPHVGGFVKAEIIEPYGLKVVEAAAILGVSRQALSTFLNEHSHLSPDMALRIEKAFGVRMDTLMKMQSSYDIAQARLREDEIDVQRYGGGEAVGLVLNPNMRL